MKTLYLECAMGASGDMLLGALLELTDNPRQVIGQLNQIGLKNIRYESNPAEKCGIQGTHVSVLIGDGLEEKILDVSEHNHPDNHPCGYTDHGHPHSHSHDQSHESHSHPHESHGQGSDAGHSHASLEHILGHINALCVSSQVKADASAIYRIIAQAESHAHGKPVSQIHFHEVGTLDAVADIVGACWLMELLAPDEIIASPIHVGSGQVHCAHGILPVPAPATAHILQGTPVYGGDIRGELCTPTGAALVKHFASRFGSMPCMELYKIGYGMGSKDFPAANCVRALLGKHPDKEDEISELSCNLDDMPGEAIGYALQLLLDKGALDVFTTPIQMKKSRPGTLLTCLCRPEEAESFAALILQHTTTKGVRQIRSRRYVLQSSFSAVSTPYGSITVKTSRGYGITKCKPEYDDVAKAATEYGVPFETVWKAALRDQPAAPFG